MRKTERPIHFPHLQISATRDETMWNSCKLCEKFWKSRFNFHMFHKKWCLSLSHCFSLCCDTSSIFNALKAATCSKPRLRWKYRKSKLWFLGDAKWLKVWSQVADKTELQDMWSILRASKGNISQSLQLMLQCCCFYTIHDFFPLHRDLHWI